MFDTQRGRRQRAIGAFIGASALLFAASLGASENGPEPAGAEPEKEKGGNYEVCAAYRADVDADLGEVLQAGCEPTLAQTASEDS